MEYYCDCCNELYPAEDLQMVDDFGFVCEFCEDAALVKCGDCKECTCG
jgi:hypothetical protein